jgi:hypothetical protein
MASFAGKRLANYAHQAEAISNFLALYFLRVLLSFSVACALVE